MELRTFEFSKKFVQAATSPYNMESGVGYLPEIQFAGSYTSSGNTLVFTLERCDPQYEMDLPALPYTATPNGLQTIEAIQDGGTLVTTYARQ